MAGSKIVAETFEGHRLKEKVGVRGVGHEIDLSAIKRAEAALGELSVNFDQWADEEVDRLLAARDAVVEHGFSGDFAEEMFRVVHDLKGEAVTFGYPLVTRIAASLCMLLELSELQVVPPIALINPHVDAIRVLVRDRIKGEDNPTAVSLFNHLSSVTNEFVETRRASAARTGKPAQTSTPAKAAKTAR